MKPAPDEADDTELPEADEINSALCPLLVAVFDLTETNSPERARAMTEVLAVADRIREALRPRPRLNKRRRACAENRPA